jgi:anti-sigma-K factor RskA
MGWQDFVTLAGAPALAVVGWLAWNARQKAEAAAEAATVKASELREKLVDCEARLSAFQLEVAQKYASVAYLKDVESRLLQSLAKVESSVEKLDAKIDRLLDRGGD